MFYKFALFCLCWWGLMGVFGADEVKSVTEGESVALHTNTEIRDDDDILWKFGSERSLIAKMKKNKQIYHTFDGPEGRFRDRLKLDRHNGSLTITDTTTEHSGDYELEIRGVKLITKIFRVYVYACLPIPVISNNSSQCVISSSPSLLNCSVVCSVVNVSHVTLSWLKGNSVLSSISVSDLSISLSLPLEVQDQDSNNYSCVVKNSISNRTTLLDISKLFPASSAPSAPPDSDFPIMLISVSAAVGSLVILFGLITSCICWKHRKTVKIQQENRSDSTMCKAKPRKMKSKEDPVYANIPKTR